MQLSIIIPTKDRAPILQLTLQQAYQAIREEEAEIIIVNDSKTSTVSVPLPMLDKVRVIDNPKNGVASARNLGASQARADLLLFMDDDILISTENIQTTLALHRQHTNCCINLNWVYPSILLDQISQTSFGRYLIYYGFTSLKGWNQGNYWSDIELFATKGITSQYLSIKNIDFFRAGKYNENFPYAGFEDYDFAESLNKIGVVPYIYPLSVMYHNESDRITLQPWLDRKKRGGFTRRVAVEMGYRDLKIQHGKIKSLLYHLLVINKKVLFTLLRCIPNYRVLDFVKFKIINILLGTSIYEGYQAGKQYLVQPQPINE